MRYSIIAAPQRRVIGLRWQPPRMWACSPESSLLLTTIPPVMSQRFPKDVLEEKRSGL